MDVPQLELQQPVSQQNGNVAVWLTVLRISEIATFRQLFCSAFNVVTLYCIDHALSNQNNPIPEFEKATLEVAICAIPMGAMPPAELLNVAILK